MTKTTRSYVSARVYQTPTGLYYDDRSGKRLTGRRGSAAGTAQKRMQARVREEETGRLGYKILDVMSDGRVKGDKAMKYYERRAEVSVSYDEEINEDYALANARKHLDEDEDQVIHFNVRMFEEIGE